MKKVTISLLILGCLLPQIIYPFCGFYVAKADAKLFNKTSQVIYVRSNNTSIITMANDYDGPLADFAMVVPVPVILQKEDIRISKEELFQRFDSYSSPRLAMYYDESPCMRYYLEENSELVPQANGLRMDHKKSAKNYDVTIEAEYEVGEYDILILSAKESDGLKRWLTDNDYKIPSKAEDVLDPYIRDNMKFFVAKVNVERMRFRSSKFLSPIQIEFQSDRFMLPIRLGMANANGDQDMIVYLLTNKGRVESANYRNVKIPTNQNIPLFVKDNFGSFYKKVFDNHWKDNKAGIHLEYSWDISSSNYVKCDPCNSTPPSMQELVNAGVNWIGYKTPYGGGSDYSGNIHFTRLHVRYNRANFPQDLVFTETSNKTNFQGRYVVHTPAQVYEDCDEIQSYFQKVTNRRYEELANYEDLTGEDVSNYITYVREYEEKLEQKNRRNNLIAPLFNPKDLFPLLMLIFSASFLIIIYKQSKKAIH